MNRNRKLIASLVGIVALTNTVMPVCAETKQSTLEYGEDFEFHLNDTENVKEQGNINLLNPSVGLVSNSNNMNDNVLVPELSGPNLDSNSNNVTNNGVPYMIQPNDTLSSIAMANNTTVDELSKNLGLTNPNKIKAGDILVSPYITEEFVLSKGQDPKQNEKQYMKIGVIKRNLTESDRNILRSLFNAEEYAKMYPDVAEACKPFDDEIFTFEQKLFYHFIDTGIWEGRQPSESFSVAAYASAYSDLKKAFGSHIVEYYKHYYNTTVIGNENRTITTVQKAQDAGIKVTDFDGNTVAVDEAGNIVTGEEADKIAAEKNLGEPIGPVIMPTPNVTVSADFNEETEKEETQAPSSEDKKEPSVPVAPTKTFAEAYKEWLASEPVGGSGNVYMVWYAKEPNLADYADGRAFLAKKEAWEKEMPDYDAYLATTAYASDYEEWQAKEPKLADYTILVGTDTAEKKYSEDYEAWQKLAPKPEDYIQYTSFEADYNAWLAAAPVPVEGKYETVQNAMDAYTEAHTEWEANKPKQSDYFDEEGYNNAVTEWTNNVPKKENYYDEEGYATAVENYNNSKPKQENYIDNDAYSNAIEMHENSKPKWEYYFKQEEYMAAQDAYTEYSEKLEAYEAYMTAKTEYDAEKAKYDAYKAWEATHAFEYGSCIKVKYCFSGVYYESRADAEQAREACKNSSPNYEVELPDIEECYFYKEQEFANEDAALNAAREGSKPTDLPKDTENAPIAPEVVESPGNPVDNPDDNQINYLMDLAKNNGATDKDSAMNLYNDALNAWELDEPKQEDFPDNFSYQSALEEWENSQPNESDYFNNETYKQAVADHEAAKPSEQDFVKESAGDATDKETALKVFEEDTASYTEESPEPTEEEYTSNVITEEEKAEFEQAVNDYNAAEPSETDSKYVEEAKETEEYKETVAKHEADKPDQSTYVDDIYETETDAVNAHEEDHRDWEGEKPSEYDYIINTTYVEDLETWEESEPDFNEYFGIEAQG